MLTIHILHTSLDDVALRLANIHRLYIYQVGSREPISSTEGRIAQRIGMSNISPFDIIILTLVKCIHNSNELMRHLGLMTRIYRQHIIPAMQVGGQFDDARPLSVVQAHHRAGSQAVLIAQLSICYQGIINGDVHLHRLTGKIPSAVGRNTCSKGTQGKHHRSYQ